MTQDELSTNRDTCNEYVLMKIQRVYLLKPIPNDLGESIMLAQANLYVKNTKPLRCLALRTRGIVAEWHCMYYISLFRLTEDECSHFSMELLLQLQYCQPYQEAALHYVLDLAQVYDPGVFFLTSGVINVQKCISDFMDSKNLYEEGTFKGLVRQCTMTITFPSQCLYDY